MLKSYHQLLQSFYHLNNEKYFSADYGIKFKRLSKVLSQVYQIKDYISEYCQVLCNFFRFFLLQILIAVDNTKPCLPKCKTRKYSDRCLHSIIIRHMLEHLTFTSLPDITNTSLYFENIVHNEFLGKNHFCIKLSPPRLVFKCSRIFLLKYDTFTTPKEKMS